MHAINNKPVDQEARSPARLLEIWRRYGLLAAALRSWDSGFSLRPRRDACIFYLPCRCPHAHLRPAADERESEHEAE